MNARVFVVLWLCWLSQSAIAQGIEFFEGGWKQALEKAQREDKLVFVDAYAKWCGPCKMMARQVFTDESVGQFYNERFINLKIDMEEAQGLDFGSKYPVRGYPTLLYLDGTGKVVHRSVGAKDAKGFVELGVVALRKNDKSPEYAKAYADGNRDFDLVFKYVQSLNQIGEPSLRIANDYLRSKPDISESDMNRFLFEAVTEADSRIFVLFVARRAEIEKQFSEEAVEEKIRKTCMKTVEKAAEYESESLMAEARDLIKEYGGRQARPTLYEADLIFYASTRQWKSYANTAKQYAKKSLKNDGDNLHVLAHSMMSYSRKPYVLEQAEKIIDMAVKTDGENIDYRITQIQVLMAAQQKEEALRIAEETLEKAKDNKRQSRQIKYLISQLQAN